MGSSWPPASSRRCPATASPTSPTTSASPPAPPSPTPRWRRLSAPSSAVTRRPSRSYRCGRSSRRAGAGMRYSARRGCGGQPAGQGATRRGRGKPGPVRHVRRRLDRWADAAGHGQKLKTVRLPGRAGNDVIFAAAAPTRLRTRGGVCRPGGTSACSFLSRRRFRWCGTARPIRIQDGALEGYSAAVRGNRAGWPGTRSGRHQAR